MFVGQISAVLEKTSEFVSPRHALAKLMRSNPFLYGMNLLVDILSRAMFTKGILPRKPSLQRPDDLLNNITGSKEAQGA